MNRIRLTAIAILIYVIVAGLVTQIGLLTTPMAQYFGISVPVATSSFSLLTGGFLLGTLAAYFLLDHIGLKRGLFIYAAIVLTTTAGLAVGGNFQLTMVLLAILGITAGVSTCIAGFLVTRAWEERRRNQILIGLDAAYNMGGLLFPLLTTYLIAGGATWGVPMLAAGSLALLVAYLTFASSFDGKGGIPDPAPNADGASTAAVEWNAGVILAAAALFMVISGKYAILLWLPHYAETALAIGPEQSAQLISAIFGTALIGTSIGIYAVTKIELRYFIMVVVIVGMSSCLLIPLVSSFKVMFLLSGLFGIAVSALYNSFVAYGVGFVGRPSHKHVSAIIVASGLAATIAPIGTGMLVEFAGSAVAAIYAGAAGFGGALLVMIINSAINRRRELPQTDRLDGAGAEQSA